MENIDAPISKSEECTPYFDFDEVEYYHINISQKEFEILNSKQLNEKTKSEDFILYVLKENVRTDLHENSFIYSLQNNLMVQQKEIMKNDFIIINEIFCEKNNDLINESACEPIYRDVLVFKKSNKLIGIAKLCFDCNQSSISGTERNTLYFGQSGDYEKLNTLLLKYRKQ